jgi:hypothetical protein
MHIRKVFKVKLSIWNGWMDISKDESKKTYALDFRRTGYAPKGEHSLKMVLSSGRWENASSWANSRYRGGVEEGLFHARVR